ncbi:O-acetyl-ADP-ribose deacetylase (regulator of RNase III) [Lysinibacillus composti]|uniref:Macro domain-containing protein n=1 Tax=Lysinibacillus composti TaxID=720633 RepID=A0A3N9UH94_9BACI|nr:macro domain-containing protein [Lysinibacillus composti]MBM7608016.1 O-acetyl-ADP-ribose deacetylase (regulator of RNase III) [Lysinibacillus composti]RQW75474.1 macro domain-containing protein [Lysinibacillus composti]
MPFQIVRNDITKMKVDAIVNAANSALQMGGGVCGAIFRAAGPNDLQKACHQIGQCAVGEAVITDGFNLPAKYIIHTVGPIWKGGGHHEAEYLTSCYINSLKLAVLHGSQSIAFPLISSGIYGYPKKQALQIAISSISEFLLEHEMDVTMVVFDQDAVQLSEKLFDSIYQYIDDHYIEENVIHTNRNQIEYDQVYSEMPILQSEPEFNISESKRSLEDVLMQLEETFSQRLLRLIDEKGKTDAETYKKANIDRRLFSKIRNNPEYTPLKKTVIAFAISLELNLDETIDLLRTAGYALSNSSKFDLIIQYFIEQKNYNIYEINEALFAFDQVLLGA